MKTRPLTIDRIRPDLIPRYEPTRGSHIIFLDHKQGRRWVTIMELDLEQDNLWVHGTVWSMALRTFRADWSKVRSHIANVPGLIPFWWAPSIMPAVAETMITYLPKHYWASLNTPDDVRADRDRVMRDILKWKGTNIPITP